MSQPPPRTRAELRAALSVQETTGEPSASVSKPQGVAITRAWRWAAPLAAVALWWPAGFAGLDDWFYLPLRARDGDLVLVGSMAATATVAALVRSGWLRLLVVVAMGGLGWLLSAPESEAVAGERMVLAVLLASGILLGLLLGARGSRGLVPLAVVAALVAGLTPATWPDGPLVAVALLLPFVGAPLRQVADAAGLALGVMVTWLVVQLASGSLRAGWDALQGGLQRDRVGEGLATVGTAAADHLAVEGLDTTLWLLADNTLWWATAAAAVLALVGIAATRAARAARAVRAARAEQAARTGQADQAIPASSVAHQ